MNAIAKTAERTPIALDWHDTKALDKAETKVVAHYNAVNAKELLHAVLVANVEFCNFHKDGSRLDKLFGKLAHTVNKSGIKTWLETFSNWQMREDGEGTVKFMSRDKSGAKVFKFDEAGRAMPFYDMPKVKANDNKPAHSLFEALGKFIGAELKHQKAGELNEVESEFLRLLIDAKAQVMATTVLKYGEDAVKPETKRLAPAANAPAPTETAQPVIEQTGEVPFELVTDVKPKAAAKPRGKAAMAEKAA